MAEWITFTADHYNLPTEIRRKTKDALEACTGKRLLKMTRADFTSEFDSVGEIIFTAFKQVLDVAPDYKGKSLDKTRLF